MDVTWSMKVFGLSLVGNEEMLEHKSIEIETFVVEIRHAEP
jgi:hypothetical protein